MKKEYKNKIIMGLVEKYINVGVHQNKIITTKNPSVVNWSLSRKCIVGENGIEDYKLKK